MSSEKNQEEYMSYGTDLLDGMQTLPSIEFICGVTRMGKEIANSKPVNITKEFDDLTGDVMYNGVTITKDHWSTSIPRTVQKFKSQLSSLFECENLLDHVLNPNNKMVLAGSDTTVTVMDDMGAVVKVINVVNDVIPLLHGADSVHSVQMTINELFSLEQGTYLYLSCGAGRGETIKNLHSFESTFQLIFNHLHFQMKSSKAVNHGVDPNDWVDHYVSPSLSRLIVVLNLCVYRPIRSGLIPELKVPIQDEAKNAARDMFKLIFGITSTNTKEYREFCILIVNYIAPSSLAKTSTTPEFASQFHHSSSMHNSTYSSTIFRRTSDGQIIRGPLLLARDYHQALGEREWNIDRVADINEDTIPSELYHQALKRGLRQPSVQCNEQQMQACKLLDDYSNHTNAVIFIPPGTGKSFSWNGILLARFLRGSKRKKFIVLSPHSALLAQHVLQSKDFFHGTSLKVISLTAADLDSANMNGDFDLCYISIHAFALIVKSKRDLLKSWSVGSIYIDECHLLFCEIFRIGNSWNSLQDIVAFETKLVALSATLNPFAIQILANYMGIQKNYEVIGDAISYHLPDVAIQVKTVLYNDLLSLVVKEICQRFEGNPLNFAIHVMTMSKKQAVTIADNLASKGISSNWLTSDDSATTRTNKMQEWANGNLKVLVSTMNCGFDCGLCKEVYIVGGVRSVADAIQSIGRIRPRQQDKSPVIFWMTEKSFVRWDETSKRNIEWEEWSPSEWKEMIETMTANHLFDGLNGDQERKVARNQIKQLFFTTKVRDIIGGNTCLRNGLYQPVGVTGKSACGMCSVCTKTTSPIRNTVVEANERVNQRQLDIGMVNNTIKTLKTRCFACDMESCTGLECVMEPTRTNSNPKLAVYNFHWCNLCFGKTVGRGAYHTSNSQKSSQKKIPLCQVATIPSHGGICKHCCMILDESIAERGKKEDHNKGQGNCIYKLRIRRILLHGTLRCTDGGISSKKLLAQVANNDNLWYEVMAKNITQLQNKKSN